MWSQIQKLSLLAMKGSNVAQDSCVSLHSHIKQSGIFMVDMASLENFGSQFFAWITCVVLNWFSESSPVPHADINQT
jgi:hypothetical protein